jgi:hypothetical protein
MKCEDCKWSVPTGVTEVVEVPKPTSALASLFFETNWAELYRVEWDNHLATSVYCYRFPKFEIMPKDRFCSAFTPKGDA